jgi:uncharacterized SAM-binding protein YcdF (DUF218 family)
MFLYVTKILTALATPLAFGIFAMALAAVSLRRTARSWVFRILVTAIVLLVFCSSTFGSHLMLRSLEWPYESESIREAPVRQAIVVLGGYMRFENRTGRPIELGGAGDRLLCALELYRAGKAPVILLSGGNLSFTSSASRNIPESEMAGRILEEWGIPPAAILIEGQSRTTDENARLSQRMLAAKGVTSILLVTSASHMRRASLAFHRNGLAVFPFPAEFLGGDEETSDTLLSLLPDAKALYNSGLAIKEWIGIAVFPFRDSAA